MQPGTQLAHYEILEAIGKGGMGEVWRAKDTKLGRDVAIKTLPSEFAEDPDRLARFEREAKLLASLNHPNIAAIYGLEEHESSRFLVLELVEGDTLGDRIKAGPIPVEESLKLALQIADALKAAHESGVVHRDLKPDNIKVSDAGTVKVLDFGLAKALSAGESDVNVSNSPTLSMAATQAGTILGTAAYMSPEQAKGRTADRRADIWAFGCVLYEMLTGRQSFGKSDVTESLAAVISLQPEWDALPSKLNPRLGEIVRRCLEKQVSKRYQDIGDVQTDLEKVLADPDGVVSHLTQAARTGPGWWAALAALLAVTALLSGFAVWSVRGPATTAPVAHLTIALPQGQQLAGLRQTSPIAVSENGDVAYVAMRDDGTQQLFLRRLGSREAMPIRGTEGAESPFFSPDGRTVGFVVGPWLKTVSIDGGVPVELARGNNPRGAVWGPDGSVIFARNTGTDGLERVSVSGSDEPTSLTVPEIPERPHRYPEVLPGGDTIIYTLGTGGSWDDAFIVAEQLDTGATTVLIEGGSDARYVPTGHLIYSRAGTLMAVAFDRERLEVTGEPVQIVDNVMQPTEITGASFVGVSSSGILAYVPNTFRVTDRRLAWIDTEGEAELLELPPRPYNRMSLSPDGQQVAVEIDEGNQQQIWIHEVSRPNSLERLTLDGTSNQAPQHAADGGTLLFTRGMRDIVTTSTDGTTPPVPVLTLEGFAFQKNFSPDGQFLAFELQSSGSDYDVWFMTPGNGDAIRPYLDSDANEQNPLFSPDGEWLAYYSDESERGEIYVRSFPDPAEARVQVSSGGVSRYGFAWARDENTLFYLNGSRMMRVDVQTQPELAVGEIREVFEAPFPVLEAFETAPDGRFLMIQIGEEHPREINIVLNWFTELLERVPVP